jgi:hypothetical protein
MIIPKSLHSLDYPDFIRNRSELINSIPKKIFPSIGLKNKTKILKLNKIINIEEELFTFLTKELCPAIRFSIKEIERNRYYHTHLSSSYDGSIKELSVIFKELKSNPRAAILKTNNKYNLVIPNTTDNLFLAIQNIYIRYSAYVGSLSNLININNSYETYNDLIALQKDNVKISFSSVGSKGNWDIATMSMRGIESCQNWNSDYKYALIGSLADPYAGIIYISNGETSLGSKMIRRAVVRYVINRKTNKPAILIERIYPFDYESGMTHLLTLGIFESYIRNKTKNKFEIQYGEFKGTKKFSIPLTPAVKKLHHKERSYRDSKIGYRKFDI